MKNIETSSPMASAPLAMMNAAISLSRSPENTTKEVFALPVGAGEAWPESWPAAPLRKRAT